VIALIARRLRDSVREADALARIGGDEFAMVLDRSDAAHARTVAERVEQLAAQPVEAEGNTVQLGCSVGIASFPEDAADIAGLLEAADRRMYRSRR
jgi:diguanylate cyclase (GGDEF)-like protein